MLARGELRDRSGAGDRRGFLGERVEAPFEALSLTDAVTFSRKIVTASRGIEIGEIGIVIRNCANSSSLS